MSNPCALTAKAIGAVLVLLFAGCESNPIGERAGVNGSGSAPVVEGLPSSETVRSWAQSLAEEELRKLAAAELLYRNHTYQFSLYTDSGASRMYSKYYRMFRDFEIVDIQRSDSLLKPVKYTIRYNFDVLGTEPINSYGDDAGALEKAREDYYFILDQQDSLTREYESDGSGRPVNPYSPYLERPNYWSYRTRPDLFGHSISMSDVSGNRRL